MLLAFCHCSLDHLSEFVDGVRHVYDLFRESMMDPRGNTLTKNSIREIINDSYFYTKLQECVTNLDTAALSLLELLHVDYSNSNDFKYLAAEVRAICTDMSRSSTQLSTRLESSVRLFELFRNFDESLNVRLLGLLAAVFLPLSLASSLLSMQTRLKNLGYLLYDFCGVIVLLGTFALIGVTYMQRYTRLEEKVAETKSDRNLHNWIWPAIQVGVWNALYLVWALLLASFLVGMIEDVGLGLRILGWGSTAIGAILLICVITGTVMWSMTNSMTWRGLIRLIYNTSL